MPKNKKKRKRKRKRKMYDNMLNEMKRNKIYF